MIKMSESQRRDLAIASGILIILIVLLAVRVGSKVACLEYGKLYPGLHIEWSQSFGCLQEFQDGWKTITPQIDRDEYVRSAK